jgi:Fic family protein
MITFNTPAEPYNNLPMLPPQKVVESQRVLKAVISASRALSHLNGLGQSIPNQTILINSVVMQEAKDSSEIENIVTTNDELYQAISIDDINLTPAVKEVIGYREALWHGYERIQNKQPFLTTNTFIELVKIINGHAEGIRKNPGTNIKNKTTGEVVYTPPVGEDRIRGLLTNLESFYAAQEDELDPLVRLAIGHYQFEAIHPFNDGNGRTGRILNILYLVQQGLLDMPILYLSRYIIQNKAEYYSLLRNVTERQDWEDWIVYILSAIENTALYTAEKLKLIKQSMEVTAETIKRSHPKMYSKDLLEILYEQPYTRINSLVDGGIASRRTSSEYLHKLEGIGVVRMMPVGRDKLFMNIRLFDILRGLEKKDVRPNQPDLFTNTT